VFLQKQLINQGKAFLVAAKTTTVFSNNTQKSQTVLGSKIKKLWLNIMP